MALRTLLVVEHPILAVVDELVGADEPDDADPRDTPRVAPCDLDDRAVWGDTDTVAGLELADGDHRMDRMTSSPMSTRTMISRMESWSAVTDENLPLVVDKCPPEMLG